MFMKKRRLRLFFPLMGKTIERAGRIPKKSKKPVEARSKNLSSLIPIGISLANKWLFEGRKKMAKQFLIILLLSVAPSFGQSSLSVAGIVIDRLGNPVVGATVMMPQSACKGCIDNPQVAYKTNA